MSIFWDTTLPLMTQKGINQIDLSKAINRPRNTIHNWIKYDRIPPADYALKIANTLNVSLEFLIKKETSTTPDIDRAIQIIKKNEELRNFLILYDDMDATHRRVLLDMLKPLYNASEFSVHGAKKEESAG